MTDTAADYLAERTLEQATNVAASLRRRADEIDARIERGIGLDLGDMQPDHGRLAADVVHVVQSLVANARLDDLIRVAADADRKCRN